VLQPSFDIFKVRNDNCHNKTLKTVSVHVNLRNVGTLSKDVFELLRRDVFSLLKFEDILGSVDDLNCAVWEHHSDIAGMKPAVPNCVLCLRLVFEITGEYRGTLETNLSSWVGAICG
jgi:hypothetical protein